MTFKCPDKYRVRVPGYQIKDRRGTLMPDGTFVKEQA